MRAYRGEDASFQDFNNDPLSKVYKYYTGDEFEEFEEDFLYEELAGYSDVEVTAKDNDSTVKRDCKQRRVNQDTDKIRGQL